MKKKQFNECIINNAIFQPTKKNNAIYIPSE